VGCATMEVYFGAGACTGWAYLADLYVEKPYRGQGLGSTMLRRVEEQVFGLGVRQVSTATAGYEGPGFYRKQGYRECYLREEHFPSGHATVGFRKSLQPSP